MQGKGTQFRAPAWQLGSVAYRYCSPWASNLGRIRTERGSRSTASGLLASNSQANQKESARIVVQETEDIDAKLARLEAVLFLAREPLSSRKLSQHGNLADGTEARTLVRLLNRKLDQFGRSFRIEEVAGGFQLVTRIEFAKWLRRLTHVPKEARLSSPSMETLAVVAYREPVTRAEIESIRGVSCGEVLNQLLARDLIRISGRSDELGRPYLYNTSKSFLQRFGLRTLEDLPNAELFHETAVDSRVSDASTENETIQENQVLEKELDEEETDVNAVVEREEHLAHDELVEDTLKDLRMEDEDFDYDDDEEFEDDDEEDDFDDDEEYEEEDDDFDDEELDEEDLDEEELEDDEELDDDEIEDDFEEEDDDVDDDEDEDDDELEEEEWSEVDDDEDDDDWDDDDWEDDEDWDE